MFPSAKIPYFFACVKIITPRWYLWTSMRSWVTFFPKLYFYWAKFRESVNIVGDKIDKSFGEHHVGNLLSCLSLLWCDSGLTGSGAVARGIGDGDWVNEQQGRQPLQINYWIQCVRHAKSVYIGTALFPKHAHEYLKWSDFSFVLATIMPRPDFQILCCVFH